MWGSKILSSTETCLTLLQLLRGVRVVVYFRNDDQILLVLRDSSCWFSLSVILISYVVGVGCSSLLLLVLSWIIYCHFPIALLLVICNIKIHSFPFELCTLSRMACCSYFVLPTLWRIQMVLLTNCACDNSSCTPLWGITNAVTKHHIQEYLNPQLLCDINHISHMVNYNCYLHYNTSWRKWNKKFDFIQVALLEVEDHMMYTMF
jgi:hypothetical protein